MARRKFLTSQRADVLLDDRPIPLLKLHAQARLPGPDEHDWFFDFEGADYAYEHGLEYLWGISWVTADGRDDYRATWALTPDEEKRALERFLEEAEAHVAAHEGAHIYHYGHYEPTALKRLVGGEMAQP